MELLLATQNPKKIGEFRQLLRPMGVDLLTPDAVGGIPAVEEDAPTFQGNAEKKARAAAMTTGRWCLADDSGLEVDHLDGAPGVHSARFAGSHGDTAANNARLLEELQGVPEERRGARFVCALALARPDGDLEVVLTGTARGRILEEARGTGGFGYDPLFLFVEEGHAATGRGFAELTADEKGEVSHRGRALVQLADYLAKHPSACSPSPSR